MQQQSSFAPAPTATPEVESIRVHPVTVKVSDLYEQAARIQEKCNDYTTKPNGSVLNTYFSPEDNTLRFVDAGGTGSWHMPMNRYAFSQLCTKLGVPMRYVEQCFDRGRPDLAGENINAWLEDYDKPLFVREYDGRVRGILSEKYMVLDTHEILGSIKDVMAGSDYTVKCSFISPERFHARIVSPTPLPIGQGNLFAGFGLDSSDVGRSVISMGFMLYDKVCTNGMMVVRGQFNLFRRRHVGGNNRADFSADFADAIGKIPTLLGDASDMIAKSIKAVNPILSANTRETTPESMMRELSRMKLSEDESKAVLEIMQNGRYDQSTRWGLVGSITEAAQKYTLERRLDMERIAGDVLLGIAA